MYSVTKRLSAFSAAHRLIQGYQGKCQHLHGHNYQVDVTISSPRLDRFGFVIDFDRIKSICNHWIQNNWDHRTLVSEADHALIAFLESEQQAHFILPQPNTSAEALAAHLFEVFSGPIRAVQDNVLTLDAVIVHESLTSQARYQPPVDR